MNTRQLVVVMLVCLSMSSPSGAEPTEDRILRMAGAMKERLVSGDLKRVAQEVEGNAKRAFGDRTRCSDEQAGEVYSAFRQLIDATSTNEATTIFSAAKGLHYIANLSSNHGVCVQQMQSQLEDSVNPVLEFAHIVSAYGRAGGWN